MRFSRACSESRSESSRPHQIVTVMVAPCIQWRLFSCRSFCLKAVHLNITSRLFFEERSRRFFSCGSFCLTALHLIANSRFCSVLKNAAGIAQIVSAGGISRIYHPFLRARFHGDGLSTCFCSLLQEYTQLFVNWWRHYYDMIERPLPQEPRHMALLAAHDVSDSWKRWSERSFVASGCGFSASVGKIEADAAMR